MSCAPLLTSPVEGEGTVTPPEPAGRAGMRAKTRKKCRVVSRGRGKDGRLGGSLALQMVCDRQMSYYTTSLLKSPMMR
jgi:hypothetical protein